MIVIRALVLSKVTKLVEVIIEREFEEPSSDFGELAIAYENSDKREEKKNTSYRIKMEKIKNLIPIVMI